MWNRNFYGGHLVLCKLGVFGPGYFDGNIPILKEEIHTVILIPLDTRLCPGLGGGVHVGPRWPTHYSIGLHVMYAALPIELLCSCCCADKNIGERIKDFRGEVSLSNYCMPCLNYDLNLYKESMQVISAYILLDKFISHFWGLVCTQNYVDFPAWYVMICHRHRAWNCVNVGYTRI